MNCPRRHSDAFAPAFTLIEIMIAVAILGLVMVMLAGSFHAVATGKVHAENRLATNQMARTIMNEMVNEIRGAVQTPLIASHVMLAGEGRMNGNAPLDSIAVSTLDPGHRRTLEDFGSEDIVSYTTAANPAHSGWYLLTRTQTSALITSTFNNNNSEVLLADNLLSLHIRYFDGNGWGESWNSASLPPGQALPQAVLIDLVMASPGGAPFRLSTMVTMPMAFQQW